MASSQTSGDNIGPDDSVSQSAIDMELDEEDLYGDQGTSQSVASVSMFSQLSMKSVARGNLFYVRNEHDQREAEAMLKVFPLWCPLLINRARYLRTFVGNSQKRLGHNIGDTGMRL